MGEDTQGKITEVKDKLRFYASLLPTQIELVFHPSTSEWPRDVMEHLREARARLIVVVGKVAVRLTDNTIEGYSSASNPTGIAILCPEQVSLEVQAMNNLRLIQRCAEWISKSEIDFLPSGVRGIYVLLRHRPRLNKFDVVYIGMSDADHSGIRGRLRAHNNSSQKGHLWTHVSVFEVWPNITGAEIEELEGLFREIYRKDKRANRLNRQKRYGGLQEVRVRSLESWIRTN